MIKRPFVIRQDIPMGGETVITTHHENGGIVLEVEHPMIPESAGVLLDYRTAVQLRDALDTLLEECFERSPYAVEQM